MEFLKKYGGAIILISLEIFFFFKLIPDDLEFFFFGWAFLGLAFLILNIFKIGIDGSMRVLGGFGASNTQAANYANMAGALAEKQYETKQGKKKLGGLFDKTNITYFLFFLANVVAYVIVMPKKS